MTGNRTKVTRSGKDRHLLVVVNARASSANNIARAFDIPGRVADAAELAATAAARPVDLLRVSSGGSCMYCVEALSAGLQADARARYHPHNSSDLREGAR